MYNLNKAVELLRRPTLEEPEVIDDHRVCAALKPAGDRQGDSFISAGVMQQLVDLLTRSNGAIRFGTRANKPVIEVDFEPSRTAA